MDVWYNVLWGYINAFLTDDEQEAFVDSVDQDQTAQNVQSDLDLHCPQFYFSS